MRQDPHRVRVGIGGQPGASAADGGTAGELADNDQGCLGDQYEAESPLGQAEGLAKAGVFEVETRSIAIAARPQERDQHGGLRGDTKRGAETQQQFLPGGEGCSGARAFEDDQIRQQHDDRHHIVGDWRPHHGSKTITRVEHLSGQDVHAVEENLWHAVVAEHDHRLVLRRQLRRFPARGGIEPDNPWHGESQQQRDQSEPDQARGHDPVGVRLAAVSVTSNSAHDLRHQNGVQYTAGQQDVHAVRHGG